MNIHVDGAIFELQSQGGISRLWRSLLPALRVALPDATFALDAPPDVFISTYYRLAPLGVKSLALVYDLIVDKYPLISNRADSADIHRAVANASAVVSISHSTAADVKRRLGCDSAVAYPGVDDDFGKVAQSDVERFQSFIGKPYIVVVGKRGGYKNVQSLYQAWKLWGAHENFKILCVGGEETLPQDVSFARRYPDIWQRVALNDHDLQLAYAGAFCCVYPSVMEGFGLPIAEAMACACPVICDSEMTEIAGEPALYCDALIPRQIAAALDSLLDPATRVKYAVAGTQHAKRYRWSAMAQVVASEIRRIA